MQRGFSQSGSNLEVLLRVRHSTAEDYTGDITTKRDRWQVQQDTVGHCKISSTQDFHR